MYDEYVRNKTGDGDSNNANGAGPSLTAHANDNNHLGSGSNAMANKEGPNNEAADGAKKEGGDASTHENA